MVGRSRDSLREEYAYPFVDVSIIVGAGSPPLCLGDNVSFVEMILLLKVPGVHPALAKSINFQ